MARISGDSGSHSPFNVFAPGPVASTRQAAPAGRTPPITRVQRERPNVTVGAKRDLPGILGFFQRIFRAIGDFFRRLFGGSKRSDTSGEARLSTRRLNAASTRPGEGLRRPPRAPVIRHGVMLGDPRGMRADVIAAIRRASRATGVNEHLLFVLAEIESSGNPNLASRSGTYVGLFQMGIEEFRANGGTGSRRDPYQNAMAAARSIADRIERGVIPPGLPPGEQALYIYLAHQQGEAGAAAHWQNPDGIAWRNIRRYYRSDRVAQRAIVGNVFDDYAEDRGMNMTSREFIDFWRDRMRVVEARVFPGGPGFTQNLV
ncbi:MAG: transglycosylase SLT domain-containing protein [Myxococcota bacterium]